MGGRGYLGGTRWVGAFAVLRSNGLVWPRMLGTFLMGEREPMSDLIGWNADATRMPYRMHSEYLNRLFLNDDLAEGKYKVDDRTITLSAIDIPMFVEIGRAHV